MEKVAIYLRKSREDIELGEDTLHRHELILNDYCLRNKLQAVKTYKEIVTGESISARPQMRQLLEDVEAGLYSGVVCVEIERLSRGNVVDQVEILDVFKESGTKIYTLQKVYDLANQDIDEEYFEFALFMSRREYKTINRRMQRGKIQSGIEGYFPYPYAPMGYVKEKTKYGYVLKEDPDVSPMIKVIFEKAAAGEKLVDIRKFLEASGIRPYKSPDWSDTTIRNIIKNPAYIGLIRARDLRTREPILAQGKHQAIISQETFEAAQKVFKVHSSKSKFNSKLRNPFATLITCSVCGFAIGMSTLKTSKDYYAYFRCNHCKKVKPVKADVLEKAIMEKVQAKVNELRLFMELAPEKVKPSQAEAEVKILEKALKEKEAQYNRACELLEKEVYTPELFKQRGQLLCNDMDEIKAQLTQARETLAGEKKRVELIKKGVPKLDIILSRYWKLDTEGKNQLLKSIVKKITVNLAANGYAIDVELLF